MINLTFSSGRQLGQPWLNASRSQLKARQPRLNARERGTGLSQFLIKVFASKTELFQGLLKVSECWEIPFQRQPNSRSPSLNLSESGYLPVAAPRQSAEARGHSNLPKPRVLANAPTQSHPPAAAPRQSAAARGRSNLPRPRVLANAPTQSHPPVGAPRQSALLPPGGALGPMQNGGLHTSSRSMPIGNLTPGGNYQFQVRAVGGSTGYSDWSDPVSHMSL